MSVSSISYIGGYDIISMPIRGARNLTKPEGGGGSSPPVRVLRNLREKAARPLGLGTFQSAGTPCRLFYLDEHGYIDGKRKQKTLRYYGTKAPRKR